jgi:hypothetical protein
MVRAAGGKIILEVPKSLTRLAAQLPEIEELVAYGSPLPSFDWQCPLMSLALAFGTDLQSIPATVPYLAVPEEARQSTQSCPWPTAGKRIGLVWAGNSEHNNDRHRSIPLSLFQPLFDIKGLNFFSMQIGAPARQLAETGAPVTDLAPHIADMADTAARIAQMDLILTVDTSVAHLAGALGKPVWILLPGNADWRWMTEREDSPWYPTARLFRQSKLGDWSQVIDRVATSLASLFSH